MVRNNVNDFSSKVLSFIFQSRIKNLLLKLPLIELVLFEQRSVFLRYPFFSQPKSQIKVFIKVQRLHFYIWLTFAA